MDGYEKGHVAVGKDAYREKIPVPRTMLAISGFGALATLPILAYMGHYQLIPVAMVAMVLAFLGNIALLGLRVAVTQGGVELHVGLRQHDIAAENVRAVELGSYRLLDYPMGRGAVRYGLKGRAYLGDLMPGEQRGVMLTTRDGKRHFIASHTPQQLLAAISERILGAPRQMRLAEDASPPTRLDTDVEQLQYEEEQAAAMERD